MKSSRSPQKSKSRSSTKAVKNAMAKGNKSTLMIVVISPKKTAAKKTGKKAKK